MCGVFGIAGPGIVGKDLDILTNLGLASQIRGRDGSGIYQIRSNGARGYNSELLYKSVDNFSTYLDDISIFKKEIGPILNNISVDVIIGHVRAKTRGEISNENSHPFMFDKIVGAHNGTLKDAKYQDPKKTDSELMFNDINERGLVPVLEELDKDSAFAITLYDKVKKEVNLVVNEMRPLSVAFLLDRGVIYWASERSMLEWILDRHGEKYKAYTVVVNKIIKFKPQDVTVANNRKNPIDCMRAVSLERPKRVFNNTVQKQQVTVLPKKEEPEKKEEPTKVENKEVSNNVIVLPKVITNTSKFNPKNYYNRCKCGKIEMNIIESHKARIGTHKNVSYDDRSKTFYCSECKLQNIQVTNNTKH